MNQKLQSEQSNQLAQNGQGQLAIPYEFFNPDYKLNREMLTFERQTLLEKQNELSLVLKGINDHLEGSINQNI